MTRDKITLLHALKEQRGDTKHSSVWRQPQQPKRNQPERTRIMTAIKSLTDRPAWKALQAHYQLIRSVHLRKLFADDPQRGERLTTEAIGIVFDYSKNRITDETLKLLLQLAEESS